MLTIRLFSVITISVLIVWRFFLPEYQQRCSAWPLDRLFRAVDYQGPGLLTTDVDNARHRENPRGYSFDPPQGPLMVDLLVWCRQAIKSWVIAHRYRIRRTRR